MNPYGAGKSTTAPSLLKGTLGVTEFVNAHVIAQGLSAFQPESAAFHAGRVMLERLHYLAKERVDFAFGNDPGEQILCALDCKTEAKRVYFPPGVPVASKRGFCRCAHCRTGTHGRA